MLVFLPYPNMRLSAHVLDSITLGEQLYASLSILRILAAKNQGTGGVHRYTMSTRIWREYHTALLRMVNCVLSEMANRGYEAPLEYLASAKEMKKQRLPESWLTEEFYIPEWMGYESMHASHRAMLKNRNNYWYSQFGWDEPAVASLIWPGKMPRVGDAVMGPNSQVCRVVRFDSRNRPVIFLDNEFVALSRSDIFRKIWRRVVVRD